MSQNFNQDLSSGQPQSEENVVALIKKIQQQLVFLEKKIYTLIGQSQQNKFSKDRPFSKNFRHFRRRDRDDNREYSDKRRDREYLDKRRGRESSQVDFEQNRSQKKKPFYHRYRHQG